MGHSQYDRREFHPMLERAVWSGAEEGGSKRSGHASVYYRYLDRGGRGTVGVVGCYLCCLLCYWLCGRVLDTNVRWNHLMLFGRLLVCSLDVPYLPQILACAETRAACNVRITCSLGQSA